MDEETFNIDLRKFLKVGGVATQHVIEHSVTKGPPPPAVARHDFKYRMALVARNVCVLRYDNEAGKGDHVHRANIELRYRFSDIDRLVANFLDDVRRWLSENGDA